MSIRDERKQQSRQALLDAALHLSTAGRSFSSISLREVAREVGLVPTAFYRHFQDMDALGRELVDQVSVHLKGLIFQIGQSYLQYQHLPTPDQTQTIIELFFAAVEHNPHQWIFMISERWGGSAILRQTIHHEIDDLISQLSSDLKRMSSLEHIEDRDDLVVISNILINLSFTWAMSWLGLKNQFQEAELKQQQLALIQQATTQVRLLFRGVANWHSQNSQ